MDAGYQGNAGAITEKRNNLILTAQSLKEIASFLAMTL
jgi:hypothetical protein